MLSLLIATVHIPYSFGRTTQSIPRGSPDVQGGTVANVLPLPSLTLPKKSLPLLGTADNRTHAHAYTLPSHSCPGRFLLLPWSFDVSPIRPLAFASLLERQAGFQSVHLVRGEPSFGSYQSGAVSSENDHFDSQAVSRHHCGHSIIFWSPPKRCHLPKENDTIVIG